MAYPYIRHQSLVTETITSSGIQYIYIHIYIILYTFNPLIIFYTWLANIKPWTMYVYPCFFWLLSVCAKRSIRKESDGSKLHRRERTFNRLSPVKAWDVCRTHREIEDIEWPGGGVVGVGGTPSFFNGLGGGFLKNDLTFFFWSMIFGRLTSLTFRCHHGM